MQAYVIVSGVPELTTDLLLEALEPVARSFALDPGTAWAAASGRGALSCAGVHHAPDRCGPRRYVHRGKGTVTFFDGIPVDPEGRIRGCDAQQLAGSWERLVTDLEGSFSAARATLDGGRAELVLDAMGMAPVYAARSAGGVLVSNSAGTLARLCGLGEPDPLGVSSFLGLGWAAGDRVLTRGIEVLAGGAVHTISDGQLRSRRHFGPAMLPAAKRRRQQAGETARRLTQLTRNAVQGQPRVGCALTAGRDSRLVAALLRRAASPVRYFTGGPREHPDVVIASEIAERFDLEHEVVFHDQADAAQDWTVAAEHFIAQNDGLASLLQLFDYIPARHDGPPLGLKLGGIGGEIGRAGTGRLTAVATNAPLLRRSLRAQRKLLAMKARDDGGLMTPAARAELARHLDRFCAERLDEGWSRPELQEAFYAFERVGRWAATAARRVSAVDDPFTPLATRPFIEYAFSLGPSERFIEAPHYRLLGELAPQLREHRFELPFPRQSPWLAPLLATRDLGWLARGYLQARLAARRDAAPAGGAERRAEPAYPFQHRWFEERRELVSEIFAERSSPLWELISRPRVLELLAGSEADRARNQEALLRASTVAWYFHGPKPEDGAGAESSSGRPHGVGAPG